MISQPKESKYNSFIFITNPEYSHDRIFDILNKDEFYPLVKDEDKEYILSLRGIEYFYHREKYDEMNYYSIPSNIIDDIFSIDDTLKSAITYRKWNEFLNKIENIISNYSIDSLKQSMEQISKIVEQRINLINEEMGGKGLIHKIKDSKVKLKGYENLLVLINKLKNLKNILFNEKIIVEEEVFNIEYILKLKKRIEELELEVQK